MCGRKTLTKGKMQIIGDLFIDSWDDDSEYTANYNIAPTAISPVMITLEGKRHVKMMRWGLIPAWAKDSKFAARMINARAETLTEKPAFRGLIKENRCIVITDGYYEWQKKDGIKQPFYIKYPDHSLMLMAGLWSTWKDKDDKLLNTYTIITTNANSQLSSLHDRMPAIIKQDNLQNWLSPLGGDQQKVLNLLHSQDCNFDVYPVSPKMNSVKYSNRDCIEKTIDGEYGS